MTSLKIYFNSFVCSALIYCVHLYSFWCFSANSTRKSYSRCAWKHMQGSNMRKVLITLSKKHNQSKLSTSHSDLNLWSLSSSLIINNKSKIRLPTVGFPALGHLVSVEPHTFFHLPNYQSSFRSKFGHHDFRKGFPDAHTTLGPPSPLPQNTLS